MADYLVADINWPMTLRAKDVDLFFLFEHNSDFKLIQPRKQSFSRETSLFKCVAQVNQLFNNDNNNNNNSSVKE